MWKEVFTFELPRGPESSEPPTLCVEVEDVDTLSSADAMGGFSVPLLPLADHLVVTQWHALERMNLKGEVSGELELVLQWRYNPDLDYDPFGDPDEHPGKDPNELRVAVVQAATAASRAEHFLAHVPFLRPGFSFSDIGTSDSVLSSLWTFANICVGPFSCWSSS